MQSPAGHRVLATRGGGLRFQPDAQKATEEKLLALPAEARTDTMEVLYMKDKQSKETQLCTLYGLLGMLTLDGYPKVKLNLHSLEKDGTHPGGLERYKITRTAEKWWVANTKPRKRKANESEPAAVSANWQNAAMHLHDSTHIPNEFVKWTWTVDLLTQPAAVLRMVSPALVWSRTIDFPDGAIFQFA